MESCIGLLLAAGDTYRWKSRASSQSSYIKDGIIACHLARPRKVKCFIVSSNKKVYTAEIRPLGPCNRSTPDMR